MTWGQKEGGISFGSWNHDRWLSQQRTHRFEYVSVVGEQIRSLSSKQSKLNFKTQLHSKIAFYAVSGHKQPPVDQTIQFWHQMSKQFWKLWLTGFFWTKFRGIRILYYQLEVFSIRESTLRLTGWYLSYTIYIFLQTMKTRRVAPLMTDPPLSTSITLFAENKFIYNKKKRKRRKKGHLTHDTWHLTPDMWHITHRDDWLAGLINDRGVFKTALATPSLLNISWLG